MYECVCVILLFILPTCGQSRSHNFDTELSFSLYPSLFLLFLQPAVVRRTIVDVLFFPLKHVIGGIKLRNQTKLEFVYGICLDEKRL